MTPKQNYDERKRLRIENDLRVEQRRRDRLNGEDEAEETVLRIVTALERIADAAELLAKQKEDRP